MAEKEKEKSNIEKQIENLKHEMGRERFAALEATAFFDWAIRETPAYKKLNQSINDLEARMWTLQDSINKVHNRLENFFNINPTLHAPDRS